MLSGGESQKVAIARAFYKKCPYVILDEPSANLDPVAEYNLNRAMMEAAEDKTVIFISHRLSTTVNADRIYVMEHGKIAEQGTHDELMSKTESMHICSTSKPKSITNKESPSLKTGFLSKMRQIFLFASTLILYQNLFILQYFNYIRRECII